MRRTAFAVVLLFVASLLALTPGAGAVTGVDATNWDCDGVWVGSAATTCTFQYPGWGRVVAGGEGVGGVPWVTVRTLAGAPVTHGCEGTSSVGPVWSCSSSEDVTIAAGTTLVCHVQPVPVYATAAGTFSCGSPFLG